MMGDMVFVWLLIIVVEAKFVCSVVVAINELSGKLLGRVAPQPIIIRPITNTTKIRLMSVLFSICLILIGNLGIITIFSLSPKLTNFVFSGINKAELKTGEWR